MDRNNGKKTRLDWEDENQNTFLLPKNMENADLIALLEQGVLYFSGEVNENMLEYARKGMLFLTVHPPREGVLTVKISSPGGDADVGLEIHDLLMLYALETGITVKGFAIGKVCSAAAMIILQGCTIRIASENSKIMCHNALTGMVITEHDLKSAGWHMRLLYDLENLKKNVVTIIMRRTKKSEQEVLKLLARARYLPAKEALAFGLLDGVLGFKFNDTGNPEADVNEAEQDKIE
ncbi:MAG: ATP-dependent Clp protease proteolytic subunit [Candidatus Paceibacterota bacterium]|jgi:ATP-dependent protease ClpP protease subunit|nr:ATP-dependent Clp protease proteolytic subunit [Candidatus Paceibacterota bacterium]